MKKIASFVLVLICLMIGTAFAGTLTGTGINQGDLYNLLSKIVTIVNELKSDHNAVVNTNRAAFGSYSTTINALGTTSPNLSLSQ